MTETAAFPLKVFGARAIVKLDEIENKTLGGIILSSPEGETANTGTVMAVGQGQRLDSGKVFPMEIAVGDRVIINAMACAPVSVPGEKGSFITINEGHILAIIDKAAE